MSDHKLTYDMLSRQDNGRITPLIIAGPPGGGKTHLAMSLARKGDPFCRIPVAGLVKEELGTQPVPEKIDTNWVIHQPIVQKGLIELLDHNVGDNYGVLLFDDVTAADPSIQSTLLEISQFGTIGGHRLGKNVAVVMTGNGISDAAYANNWSTALINRSHYIQFKPSLQTWFSLPDNANADPIIYGFLKNYGTDWFAPEISDQKQKQKCFDEHSRAPSPRQWTTLANSLMDKWGGLQNFQESILFRSPQQFIASLVGDKGADAVMVYARVMMNYPTAQELMEDPGSWMGKTTPELRNQAGSVFAVAHSVRQYFINENEKINNKGGSGKSKAVEAEKDALIKKLCYTTAALMGEQRDLGSFVFRYVLQNLDAKDITKGLMANYAFNIGNTDPVLRNAGFDKLMADIKSMDNAIRGTPSP